MAAELAGGPLNHPVVSREQWLAARKTLLEKEKAFTRLRDVPLSEARRAYELGLHGHVRGKIVLVVARS